MVDNEKPSTIVDGYTYSLQETKMYSKKAEEKLEQLKIEEDRILRGIERAGTWFNHKGNSQCENTTVHNEGS